MHTTDIKTSMTQNGFAIVPSLFNAAQLHGIINTIEAADTSDPSFRKNDDLFAIRRVLQLIPDLEPLVLTIQLKQLIDVVFGPGYFVVKSIYFDKPAKSNWFVAYHQDLTISVANRIDASGYNRWTVKQGLYAVQPPAQLLEDNFTIRIHLDETTEANGALHVIPSSHNMGIYRAEAINHDYQKEMICNVPAGGAMLMRPLLMHASSRTTNEARRRVIHIEFSRSPLPEGMSWEEYLSLS